MSIEDCSGSGCTPSAVLASGTTSATYNVDSLAAGTYTMDACDTTAGVCSASNVLVVSPAAATYTYGGQACDSSSCSVTLNSGYTWYFCGASYEYGISSTSWTADEQPTYLSIGHQTSNICSTTQSSSYYLTVGGVGTSASSYTIATSGTSSTTSFGFSWTPSSSTADDFVILSTIYSISSISLPSGCTELGEYEESAYNYVYTAVCTGYSSYSISGVVANTGTNYEAWVVYDT